MRRLRGNNGFRRLAAELLRQAGTLHRIAGRDEQVIVDLNGDEVTLTLYDLPPLYGLPPTVFFELRAGPATNKGAHDFAQHLLTKAAERLPRGDYYCRRLGLHLSWVGDLGGWWNETDFHETRDTGFLLARIEELWQRVPRYKPLSVGVVLLDLVPADHHQPDLFAADDDRRQKLLPLIDLINDRYGRCAIGFGLFPPDVRAFKGYAAFHRVPESWEF